jgi:hypothetical protein
MTNHDSDAADSAREAAIGGLLATLVRDYNPAVDLVPAALAGARRAKRRARVAWTAGGGLFAAAAAAAVLFTGATGTGSVPTTGATAGGGTATQGAAPPDTTTAAHKPGALDTACVGKWLPWSGGSESAMFGKGTVAQRAVVCTNDIEAMKTIMPGLTIVPYFEQYAAGASTDFTTDQIAQLGPGLSPDTHILEPWQYTVTLAGRAAYFYISYSTTRSSVCTSCAPLQPQPLAGPRAGYRLVGETPRTDPGTIEVLVETPAHAYFGIGVSPVTGGTFTPPLDVTKLVKDGRFIAALDTDLRTLYGG